MYNDLSPQSEVPVPLECRMFAICIAITPICTALAHRRLHSELRPNAGARRPVLTIDLPRNQQCVILFSARRSNNARRVPMQTKLLLCLIIFSSLTFWAADKITPLNIKEGLWEMTVTHSMTGMPAIPPETLARMPPEQRPRAEAAMKGTPTADVHKECVTKEKLEKQMAFDENRKDKDDDCIRTIVNATGSKLE